jgi:hypothetical protein
MKRPKRDGEPADEKLAVNTRRLETLADVAAKAADAKRWQARKFGLADQEEASEVRNLTQDTEARAQAEAAMKEMMAKAGGKPRRRY